jgi:hypothetical protein
MKHTLSTTIGILLGLVMVAACIEIAQCSRAHTEVAP